MCQCRETFDASGPLLSSASFVSSFAELLGEQRPSWIDMDTVCQQVSIEIMRRCFWSYPGDLT